MIGKLVNIAGGAITLFLGLILWILFSVIGAMEQVMGYFDPTLYNAMVASFLLMIFGPVLFWIVLPLIERYRRKTAWPMPMSLHYCRNCGKPLKYNPQLQRWYCESCGVYL